MRLDFDISKIGVIHKEVGPTILAFIAHVQQSSTIIPSVF